MEALQNQISCKRARVLATEEIEVHIQEQKAAYRKEGIEEKQAEEKALKDMGDPLVIGQQLNEVHRPKVPWIMLGIIFALITIGVFLQFDMNGTFRGYAWYLLGIGLMLLLQVSDYTILMRKSKRIWILTVVGTFLICHIQTGNTIINGQQCLVYYSSVILIPALAVMLYSCRNKGYKGMAAFCLACFSIIFNFLNTEGNRIRLFEITLICIFLFIMAFAWDWFGVGRKKSKILLIFLAALLFLLAGMILWICIYQQNKAVFLSEYRMEQIRCTVLSLFGGEEGAESVQYQFVKLREAMEQANWIGMADCEGLEAIMGFLPMIASNRIIFYVSFHYGILAGLALTFLTISMSIVGMYFVWRQKNTLGKMIGFSCNFFFLLQTICYSLTDFGIIDLSMLETLPFLSAGNKMFLTFSFIMGMNLSVYRNQNIVKEPIAGKVI